MPSNPIAAPDAAPYILEMHGITKLFPGVRALDNVTLQVARGEVHAICGENGAGKSTLMKVLSGVYPSGSYDGEIVLDGHAVHFSGIKSSEAQGIVIIHQELALSPHLSIAENIFLGNEISRFGLIDRNKTNAAAAKLLARVGLDEKPTTIVSHLGVGKQQLVEIAKALAKEVKVLILDEPTAALNDDDSAHLLELIRQLKAQGITSIIISHKLNEIAAIADSTTIIRDGRSIETLAMSDGVDEARIIKGMVGRDMESRFPPHDRQVGDEKLRIENWSVRHPLDPSRTVVDDVSLNVRAGEVVGIAGLMGAGRTELAMSVFGHAYGRDISGRLVKDGAEIRAHSVAAAIEHGLAYATEDRKHYGLNLIQDIRRNTSIAALQRITRRGLINDHEDTKIAEGFRGSMNIKAPTVSTVAGQLSGGNQQKVGLSKWMFTEPDVLILDEPTRGIDVGAKYEIYVIINDLADAGKSVIVISPELAELVGICDRIYTLCEGRITGEFDASQADQETLMRHMTMETGSTR